MRTISFKEKYVVFLIMICFIVVGLYYSYAIFVTKQLQENVVSLKTMESNVTLSVNGKKEVVVKANSNQDLEIKLKNNSAINYNYQLYYQGNTSHLLVTYLYEEENRILGNAEKNIKINVVNNNQEDVTIKFLIKTSLAENIDKEIGYSYINTLKNYDHSGANAPEIGDLYLIPVSYHKVSDKDGYWYKISSDNTEELWYDYDHGIWANAVLVSKSNFKKYQQMPMESEIEIGDILGFYVWIPRFKYTVTNYNNYTSFEKMNNVIFEKGDETTGTISCQDKISNSEDKHLYSEFCFDGVYNKIYDNLSTYTHPAFQNKKGFWVSKFLMTEGNNMRSIPNTKIIKKNLMDALTLSQKIVNGKSHLLSNMEYGAVTILSNSSYGKSGNNNYYTDDNYTFKRIYNNNYMYELTGCSTDYNNFSKSFITSTSKTCVPYNDLTNASHISNSVSYNVYEIGAGASTTGTIYGVYDMANIWGEIVNAQTANIDGSVLISDFDGDTYSYNEYQGVLSSSANIINLHRYKLGDAIKENFRTLSTNGMWQGGMMRQTENIGVILRGGNGDIKNASIYTAEVVSYDVLAPFRVVLSA